MFSILNIFKITAYLEGISYLLLMAASIYKRLPNGDDYFVKLLGMPHGILFMLYMVLAFVVRNHYKWTNKEFVIVLLASIFPFGTFYIDRKYLKS